MSSEVLTGSVCRENICLDSDKKNYKKKSPVYQYIRVFKIVSPVRSDLPLASYVPHIQFKTLALDTLDVESLRRMTDMTPSIHLSAPGTESR